MDSLRGLAIVLMVVDHIWWLFVNPVIEPGSVRFFTRLSMPLFCVLLGYFLVPASTVANWPAADRLTWKQLLKTGVGKRTWRWRRLAEMTGTAIVLNLMFASQFEGLEILVSLVAAVLAYGVLGRWFLALLLAGFLFPIDASRSILDYPLTAVVPCVAAGLSLRVLGWRGGLVATGAVLVSSLCVTPATVYVLYFLPLAMGLVMWAAYRSWSVWGLQWLGRYPLTAYATQYVVLLTIYLVWHPPA